jgi:putative spermidine/putrescine transport system substrate-binding protein
MNGSIMRRRFAFAIFSAAVIAALIGGALPAAAQNQLVVASFGGAFQDAQRQAYFQPFEKATGIHVVEVTGVPVAKVQTMVETGNMEWDVFMATLNDYAQFLSKGLVENIDYSKMDANVLGEMDPRVVKPNALGAVYSGQVIAYGTEAFSAAHHPQSWAQFWDVKQFPGPRLLPAGDYVLEPIEPALLAAGVPADKIYPPNLPLAYDMLSKIKPHVVEWVHSSSAGPQALVNGDAVVTIANPARINELKRAGAAVDFDWNQALLSVGYWVIAKGAKDYTNAMKFLNFVSQAEHQVAFVKRNPLGPTNRRALSMLSEDEQRALPSYPANAAKGFLLQPEQWTKIGPSGKSYYAENIAMWNDWSTK